MVSRENAGARKLVKPSARKLVKPPSRLARRSGLSTGRDERVSGGAKPDTSHFAHFAGAKPDISHFAGAKPDTSHFAGAKPDISHFAPGHSAARHSQRVSGGERSRSGVAIQSVFRFFQILVATTTGRY